MQVSLSSVKDIPSSDYINANFVYGYKERKKFICAQGERLSRISFAGCAFKFVSDRSAILNFLTKWLPSSQNVPLRARC